jgi:hypothetical protein
MMTPAQENPLHLVVTSIPFEQLLDFLTGRRVLCLPEGAELKSWWKECHWWEGIESDRRVCLKIEHASFPETERGAALPRVQIPQARIKELSPADDKAISKAKLPSSKTTRRRIVIEEIITS